MIQVKSLTKVYPNGVCALRDVDLDIPGGVFGLLGPNGAGKTTLMRILATLLRPTSGAASVFGLNLQDEENQRRVRQSLGYLPQELGLLPQLTAEQFLDYVAIHKGISDSAARAHEVDTALKRVGLFDSRRLRLKTFSGGMKRRVGLAQAQLGNPRLLIVDEPTAGLDPAERVRFRNRLSDFAGDRVIVLSTHIVEDISLACQELAVLREGRVVYRGRTRDLILQTQGCVWQVEASHTGQLSGCEIVSSTRDASGIQCRVLSEEAPAPNARPCEPNLEDAYLWLMKQSSGE